MARIGLSTIGLVPAVTHTMVGGVATGYPCAFNGNGSEYDTCTVPPEAT